MGYTFQWSSHGKACLVGRQRKRHSRAQAGVFSQRSTGKVFFLRLSDNSILLHLKRLKICKCGEMIDWSHLLVHWDVEILYWLFTHGKNIEYNICVFAWRLNTPYSVSVITVLLKNESIYKCQSVRLWRIRHSLLSVYSSH